MVGSVAEMEHVEGVEQRATPGAEQRGELAEHDHRRIGVLITDSVIREVAVAFLGTEQEERGVAQGERGASTERERGGIGAGAFDQAAAPVLEFAGDPLEADECLDTADAMAGTDRSDQRGRDERFHHGGIGRTGVGQNPGIF